MAKTKSSAALGGLFVVLVAIVVLNTGKKR